MKEKKHLIPDTKGFSIVEVMISVLIFSIGALAVASMQLSGIHGNTSARQYTETSTLGMDKIETLMSLPYNHPDLTERLDDADGVLGLFDATAATADWNIGDPAGQYTIYWNVAEEDLIEKTKTLSVIIVWNSPGMQRRVSMQRVIPEII